MSSRSLSETKRKLLTTHERMSSAYSMLCESLPSHTNEVDAWLVDGIHERQAELRELMAKIAKLHDRI
jgi:hypothetical protein